MLSAASHDAQITFLLAVLVHGRLDHHRGNVTTQGQAHDHVVHTVAIYVKQPDTGLCACTHTHTRTHAHTHARTHAHIHTTCVRYNNQKN